MDLNLEVLASVSVKRKRPSASYAWLGEPPCSYGLFLLDRSRISQLSLETGKTQRRLPAIGDLHMALTVSSPNGAYLGGLTTDRQFFLWHKATDVVWTYDSPLSQLRDEFETPPLDVQGHKVFLSDRGEQALLVCSQSELFLWEVGGTGSDSWWKITPPDGVLLPQSMYRETSIDACFFVHPVLGECCVCAFVFTSRQSREVIVTHLLIRWSSPTVQFYSTYPGQAASSESCGVRLLQVGCKPRETPEMQGDENAQVEEMTVKEPHSNETSQTSSYPQQRPLRDMTNCTQENQLPPPESFQPLPSTLVSEKTADVPAPTAVSSDCTGIISAPFTIQWKTKSYSPDDTTDQHFSPTGRGCFVAKLSPTGNVLALAINRSSASDSQILFYSLLTDSGVSSPIHHNFSASKIGRTYWIADMAWSADGLLLVCVTRRGSLMILPRYGQPLKLTTHGCSLDMGPSYQLPLHPLITIVGATRSLNVTNHENSQSSEKDALRQRFSVATHPRYPVILCSDGYSLTVLRVEVGTLSLPDVVGGLVSAASHQLGLPPSELCRNEIEQISALDESESTDHVRNADKEKNSPSRSSKLKRMCEDLDHGFDGTISGSLVASGGAGFLAEISGVEEGVIHFAGVDSDLEQTQVLASGPAAQKENASMAIATLQTALAILFSTDSFTPGNGMYPSDTALSSKQIALHQFTVEHTRRLLISTFVLVVRQMAALTSAPQAFNDDLPASLATGALSVMNSIPLDSITQNHFSLSVSLINALSWVVVSEGTRTRQKLLDVLSGSVNLQSLKECTDLITSALSTVAHFVSEALSQIEAVYSSKLHIPAIGSSIQTSSDRDGLPASAIASNLAAPLFSLIKLTSAFSSDIEHSINAGRQLVPHQVTSRLQAREFELLYGDLTNSTCHAVSVVQNIKEKAANLLQALAVSPPSRQPTLGVTDRQQLNLKPITSEPQQEQGQQQNQQLSLTLTAPAKESLSVLLSRLEQYDLKGALHLAYSMVAGSSEEGTQPTYSASLLQRNPLERSGDTGRVEQPKSLSSLHPDDAPTVTSTDNHIVLMPSAPIQSADCLAVMACLARFMVSYFVNYPLLLPPSTMSLDTVPTLHPPLDSRYNELDCSLVSEAVREQNISSVWTVDHVLRLLLMCELWEEACDFVSAVGDWRKAFLIASVHLSFTRRMNYLYFDQEMSEIVAMFMRICHQLAVRNILSSLEVNVSSNEGINKLANQQCMDVMEPHSLDVLHNISSTLQACAAIELDSVLISSLHTLIAKLEAQCKQLRVLVSSAVYLPTPPLYCLQPGVSSEDFVQSPKDWTARRLLATLIQHILTVLKASNCLQLCIQSYTEHLLFLPEDTELSLPVAESAKDSAKVCQVSCDGRSQDQDHFVQQGVDKDKLRSSLHLLEGLFRHLCGLLWFLHVRDQASMHLRRLHPTVSLTTKDHSTTDPVVLKEAALWSARLLPFSDFLSSSNSRDEIPDVVLSTLLELPSDAFLADLLAVCFPQGAVEDNLRLNAKLLKLVAKLRSVANPHPDNGDAVPEPLSVRYQAKSQRVLEIIENASVGQFRDHVLRDTAEIGHEEMINTALGIGSYSFEHDTEYQNFLSTLFAVVSPPDEMAESSYSLASIAAQKSLQNFQPCLGSHCSFTAPSDPSCSCWKQTLPLITFLSEWSKSSPQNQRYALHTSDATKGRCKEKPMHSGPTLRVEVPVPLLVSCLQFREEKLLKLVEEREHKNRRSQLGPISGDEEVASDKSQSLRVSDLQSMASKPPALAISEGAASQQPSSTALHSGFREEHHLTSVSLLQVPEGILQGKVTPEALHLIGVQDTVAAAPQEQLSLGSGVLGVMGVVADGCQTESPVGKDPTVMADDRSFSQTEAFTLDEEVTESASTGELPSAVTFSVGEFGSRFPAGDTTVAPEMEASTKLHDTTSIMDRDSIKEPVDRGGDSESSGSQQSRGGGGECEGGGGEGEGGGGEGEGGVGGGEGAEGSTGESGAVEAAEEEGDDGGSDPEDENSETEKADDSPSITQDSPHSSSSVPERSLETLTPQPSPPPQSVLPSEHGTAATERHSSGATTMTDSHGAELPDHMGPMAVPNPIALESSITTGSTEEGVRQLGFSLRAGPVQSTAMKMPPASLGQLDQGTAPFPVANAMKPPAPPVTHLPAALACPLLQPATAACVREDDRKESRAEVILPEKIGSIVKSEMKRLLKLQHERLLDLLDTSTPESTASRETAEPMLAPGLKEHLQTRPEGDTPHTATGDGLAPMVDLDELQSTVHSSHSTHIAIPVVPTEVEASPQQVVTNGGLSDALPPKQSDPVTTKEESTQVSLEGVPTAENGGTQSSDLSLSELTSGQYSLGAVLPRLDSTSQHRRHNVKSRRRENRVTFKAPMKDVASQGEPGAISGQRPALLHVDLLTQPSPSEQMEGESRSRRVHSTLQEEYPHLTNSLKLFDLHTSRQMASTQLRYTNPPLLLQDLREHGMSSKPSIDRRPPQRATRPSPPPVTALPLLRLPGEGSTLPGMVPPHGGLPLQPHHLPHIHQKPSAMEQVPVVPGSRQPLPLLSVPSWTPAPAVPDVPRSHPDYQLAEVPLRPYAPRLVPPHLLEERQRTKEPPPLLRLEGAMERMRQDGFQLLHLPPEERVAPPRELLDMHPHQPHPAAAPVPARSRKEMPRNQQIVSDASTGFEDNAVSSYGETLATEDRTQKRQKSKSRKRRAREKHVSKKEDRQPKQPVLTRPKAAMSTVEPTGPEEPDKAQPSTAIRMRPEPILVASSGAEPQTTTSIGLRHPRPVSEYPTDVPQERLEVRRLQTRASYLRSSTSDQEEEERVQEGASVKGSSKALTNSDSSGNMEHQLRYQPSDHKSIQRDVRTEHVTKWAEKSIQVELGSADKSVQVKQVADALESGQLPSLTMDRLRLQARAPPSTWSKPASGGRQFISVVDIEGDPETSLDVTLTAGSMASPMELMATTDEKIKAGRERDEEARTTVSNGNRQFLSVVDIVGGSQSSLDMTFTDEAVVTEEARASEREEVKVKAEEQCEGEGLSGEEDTKESKMEEGEWGAADTVKTVALVTSSLAPLPGVEAADSRHYAPAAFPGLGVEPADRSGTQSILATHLGRLDSRSKVIHQLQQLEEQLNAIESTARSVEGEFQSSAQLLKVIDQLEVVSGLTPTTVATPQLPSNIADVGSKTTPTIADLAPPTVASVGAVSLSAQPQEKVDAEQTQDGDPMIHSKPSAGPSAGHEEKLSSGAVQSEAQERGEGTPQRDYLPAASPMHSSGGENGKAARLYETEREGVTKRSKGHVKFALEEKGRQLPDHVKRSGPSGSGGRREEMRQWVEARRRQRSTKLATDHAIQSGKATSELARLRKERQQLKREQEREFHAKRIESAFSLMQDILTSKPKKPRMSAPPTPLHTYAASEAVKLRQQKRVSSSAKRLSTVGLPPRAEMAVWKIGGHARTRTADPKDCPSGSSQHQHRHPPFPSLWNSTEIAVGSQRSSPATLTRSPNSHKVRRISSVEGLTEDEQVKIATILASTEYERDSTSPGSIASSIDWEEIDKILEN